MGITLYCFVFGQVMVFGSAGFVLVPASSQALAGFWGQELL